MRTLHIGLGEVGLSLAKNALDRKLEIIGFDVSASVRDNASDLGIPCYGNLEDAISALNCKRKIIIVTIPAEHVTYLLEELCEFLSEGDCIVDVGNSFFKDSIIQHQQCSMFGINFIDCGLLGGVYGARNGASLLLGGENDAVSLVKPCLEIISNGNMCVHAGGPGSGHFAKMIHNSIEYSMMGAIAEGFYMLDEHKKGLDLNISSILESYTQGSVIESRLIKWLNEIYKRDSSLHYISETVSPEKRDMNMEYITRHETARILEAALIQRKLTRLEPSTIGLIINAMRSHFGDSVKESKVHKNKKLTSQTPV